MDNLYTLINKFGEPDALVDHWDKHSKRCAVWGFNETFLISNEGIPFLNGNKSNLPPLDLFQSTLNRWKKELNGISVIGYMSYDLKNILYPVNAKVDIMLQNAFKELRSIEKSKIEDAITGNGYETIWSNPY